MRDNFVCNSFFYLYFPSEALCVTPFSIYLSHFKALFVTPFSIYLSHLKLCLLLLFIFIFYFSSFVCNSFLYWSFPFQALFVTTFLFIFHIWSFVYVYFLEWQPCHPCVYCADNHFIGLIRYQVTLYPINTHIFNKCHLQL